MNNQLAEALAPGSTLKSQSPLTGGVSADVYHLVLELSDGSEQSFVLRSHGKNHAGHPAALEYELLRALHDLGLKVPQPIYLDDSGSLQPEPFIVISFMPGSSRVEPGQQDHHIEAMAKELVKIHELPIDKLPALPIRQDPLPELFGYVPEGPEWQNMISFLKAIGGTEFTADACLLHGDFWPENLLWQDGELSAVLDWEDAAMGDPLSDVACTSLELRYLYGRDGMDQFIEHYASHAPADSQIDRQRLALWHIYVASAAQKFMGQWQLPAMREEQMREAALSTIAESYETLKRHT